MIAMPPDVVSECRVSLHDLPIGHEVRTIKNLWTKEVLCTGSDSLLCAYGGADGPRVDVARAIVLHDSVAYGCDRSDKGGKYSGGVTHSDDGKTASVV